MFICITSLPFIASGCFGVLYVNVSLLYFLKENSHLFTVFASVFIALIIFFLWEGEGGRVRIIKSLSKILMFVYILNLESVYFSMLGINDVGYHEE